MISALNPHGPSGNRSLAVSPGDAAKMIGIGRTKIYEEIGSGALRSAKIGARRLITIAALEEWLAAREVGHRGDEDAR